jgi:hypothetical protein
MPIPIIRVLGCLLGVAILVAFAYVLLELPEDVVSEDALKRKDILDLRNDVRTTGVQLVGGVILALGTVATAWNALSAWRVSHEGQITERFTRAVEQLASPAPDIRLGGIYALERLARDSKRDHSPIMHVLTTYLREHTRWPRKGAPADERPAPDVQAAITVLGRRKVAHDSEGMRLDLSGIDLELADLIGADLRRANLAETNLKGALLDNATLDDANLTNAVLANARAPAASMRRANLTGANLERASLPSADLRAARFADASLRGANLTGARGADLDDAIYDDQTRLP